MEILVVFIVLNGLDGGQSLGWGAGVAGSGAFGHPWSRLFRIALTARRRFSLLHLSFICTSFSQDRDYQSLRVSYIVPKEDGFLES